MYENLSLALRAFGGVALALMLGFVGLVIIFALFFFMEGSWPRWVFVLLWFSSMGVAAAVGSYLPWHSPDFPRRLFRVMVISVLTAGLMGAWGGYVYKAILFDDPAVFTGRAITSAALIGAVISANIVAASLGIWKYARYSL